MSYMQVPISTCAPWCRTLHWQFLYAKPPDMGDHGIRQALTRILVAQIALTAIILFITIFVLGFFADPIIRLYLDPWSFLFWGRSEYYPPEYYEDEERSTWYQHFAKGFASMGVLGFLKVLLASPLSYFRIGGGRGRNTTRERYEQVSWVIILIGVFTFLVVSITISEDDRKASNQSVGFVQRRSCLEPSSARKSRRASHGRPR